MKTARLVLLLALTPSVVLANPTVTATIRGSGFFANAVNAEDRGYNCVANYTIGHTDYGTYTETPFNVSFAVQSKSNGVVIQSNLPWAASTLKLLKFEYQCS